VSLRQRADGRVRAARRDDAVTSDVSLSPGRWAHLAMTYNGERLSLFIDGVPVAETAAQTRLLRINSLPVLGNSSAFDAGFQGLVGGFHLQSGVLTPSQFILPRRVSENTPNPNAMQGSHP